VSLLAEKKPSKGNIDSNVTEKKETAPAAEKKAAQTEIPPAKKEGTPTKAVHEEKPAVDNMPVEAVPKKEPQDIQETPVEKPRPPKPKKPKKDKKLVPKLNAKETEETIVSLANAGHTASEIGLMLRDQQGIGDVKVLTKKTITELLEKHKLLGDVPEDLMSLVRKSVMIKKHMAQNKNDMSAKRGYQLTVSKIRRLSKYYTKSGKLPKGWRYSEETAALLVK
jgi:small subunit ribosomal protein S15